MKRFVMLAAFVAFMGCASPAKDYVEADAAAWAEYDPLLDKWIDGDASISPEKKDALHQLNDARKARIKHAQEQFKK